jgi:hypothetical protein
MGGEASWVVGGLQPGSIVSSAGSAQRILRLLALVLIHPLLFTWSASSIRTIERSPASSIPSSLHSFVPSRPPLPSSSTKTKAKTSETRVTTSPSTTKPPFSLPMPLLLQRKITRWTLSRHPLLPHLLLLRARVSSTSSRLRHLFLLFRLRLPHRQVPSQLPSPLLLSLPLLLLPLPLLPQPPMSILPSPPPLPDRRPRRSSPPLRPLRPDRRR